MKRLRLSLIKNTKSIILGLTFLGMGGHADLTWAAAPEPTPLPGIELRDLRMIPMLSGGRLKPFDEFSRELLLAFTGNRSYGNFDPSELMISIMVRPAEWAEVEWIRVGHEETRKQLLLDLKRKFFSANELTRNNAFLQYAEGLRTGSDQQVVAGGVSPVTAAMDPRAEELKRVVDRVAKFQALVSGELWMVTPSRGEPGAATTDSAWAPLARGMQEPSPQSDAVYALLKAYLNQDVTTFNTKAAETRLIVEQAISEFDEVRSQLVAEVYYNRLRPFFQALWAYLLAGVLWMFVVSREQKRLSLVRYLAKSMTFAAIALHAVGFALRCYVAGRPPVTNMYESIIWVSFGVMVFALLIYARTGQRVLMSISTLLAGISLFAADAAPLLMDPTIRPLVPVLRSNYWLTIHVLTITASYGAFMLAMGIANVAVWQYLKIFKSKDFSIQSVTRERISLLNQLNYRALIFGTVLLFIGTVLGGIWADYSWGRFWGWDPKEVWALIAFLAYMAILHARYTGWMGAFGFPVWTALGFSTVVMAWYGVNFVLGVGLHSYGFSSGGQGVVSLFVLVQIGYCSYAWLKFRQFQKSERVSSGTEPGTHASV